MGGRNTTVLVVNWNTPFDLERCVRSGEAFEKDLTWVIHQNNHDQSRPKNHEVILRLKDELGDRLEYFFSSTNVGHGAGINHAAFIAEQKFSPYYYFAINPDVEWTSPVVDLLKNFVGDKPRIVGPKQIDSQWRITAGGIIGEGTNPQHRFWHQKDPKNLLARDTIEGPMVAGSAFLLRKDDFHAWGGLAETNHYYSETWLCYHARAHGGQCFFYGEPWMVHEWHRSSAIGSPLTDGKFQEDKKFFVTACERHLPRIPHD